MLHKLLSRLHGSAIEAGVASLSGQGALSDRITQLGVPVWHLNLKHPWQMLVAPLRLRAIVRQFHPVVIQGWMYHGNIAAYLARRLAPGNPSLAFGIRHSIDDLAHEKRLTRLVIRLGVQLSPHTDAILYNSEMSRAQHEAYGYDGKHARVIDNGFDTTHFRPDSEAYRSVREELGLAPEARLIGLVARYHPIKGHEVFLAAARLLADQYPDAHFLLAGRDVTPEHQLFLDASADAHVRGRLHLLGERRDIPRLTAALDIATSSSWGEAFPNAIGEAMSCGVPCVATAVGDCRRIVGDTGRVVPPGDVAELAAAIGSLLQLSSDDRRAFGDRARARMAAHFNIGQTVKRYGSLYEELAAIRRGKMLPNNGHE